jgi:VanZ family protein
MTAPAAPSATTPHRRVLVLVVALILYGSLYPWEFQARHYAASPLWILLHSWPTKIDRFFLWDVGINMVLYLPLGIFGYLAVSDRAPFWARVALPLGLGLALSSSIEMLQLYDDSRMCSLSDVTSNLMGTAGGIVVGGLYQRALRRLLSTQPAATLLRPTGALLLLGCWLGYQLFPLFPAWGRTSLFRRLAALEHAGSISPVETLLVFAEWLAVACLLDSILKPKATALLGLMLLVLPARLLLATRTLTWPDIAGAAAAFAAWLCLPRRHIRHLTPVLVAGALILGDLRPFHFQGASPFVWVPFRGVFRANWQNGFVILFRKSFWYGSAIWLWRSAGYRLAWTAAIAAAALFFLERLQTHLPGRTPEITDPLLAVLMGVLLWLLRDA